MNQCQITSRQITDLILAVDIFVNIKVGGTNFRWHKYAGVYPIVPETFMGWKIIWCEIEVNDEIPFVVHFEPDK